MPKSKVQPKHIHDDPGIDCPACVEWIKRPMTPISKAEQGKQSKTKDKGTKQPKIEETVKERVGWFVSDLAQWIKGNSFSNGKSLVVDQDSLLKKLSTYSLLDTKKDD